MVPTRYGRKLFVSGRWGLVPNVSTGWPHPQPYYLPMSEVYLVKLDVRYITTSGAFVFDLERAHPFVDKPFETALAWAKRVVGYHAANRVDVRVVRLADGVEHELA